MKLLSQLDAEDRNVTGTIATTFTFGGRFFESQILDAITDRHQAQKTVIPIDASTYAETLESSTTGDENIATGGYPKAVGQRYYLVPVEGGSGTFHPKIVYQAGEKRANAFIGSANLTQQGYTSNREVVTHITAETDEVNSESAGILRDCREYLSQLLDHQSTIGWGQIASEQYESILSDSQWLMDAPVQKHRDSWVLHNLDTPLLEQVRDYIDGAGDHITAVDIIAPFYGTGLSVPEHFTDNGIETTVYLQNNETQINTSKLTSWLESPHAAAEHLDADRYVHGKVLLIRTDQCSYCFSGSANASWSALFGSAGPSDGVTGNHEVGILRRTDDPTQFNYLLNSEEMSVGAKVDAESFVPGVSTEFESYDDGETDESIPVITAPVVAIYQRPHGGSRISIETTIDTEYIDPQREQLSLKINRVDTDNSEAVPLYPADRLRRETDRSVSKNGSRQYLRYSKVVSRNQMQRLLGGGCRVSLETQRDTGDQFGSDQRWAETSHSSQNRSNEITARVGTDTVPQIISELFLLEDVDQRESLLSSLNGVISGLRETVVDVDVDETDEQETPHSESRQDGIRVREWDSAPTSSDPGKTIGTFYDHWLEDLTELTQVRTDPDAAFDATAARLRAINQCNIKLLALKKTATDQDIPVSKIPTERPASVTNQLFTRRTRGQLDSRLSWFLTRGTNVAEQANEDDNPITPELIYSWCQEDILPHIIVGALVAENQLSSSIKEYHRYFGTSFEELVLECFEDGRALARWASNESIDLLLASVREIIDPMVDQLDRHSNDKWLPYTFRDNDRLEEAAIGVLARALVEDDSVTAYRTVDDRCEKLLHMAQTEL